VAAAVHTALAEALTHALVREELGFLRVGEAGVEGLEIGQNGGHGRQPGLVDAHAGLDQGEEVRLCVVDRRHGGLAGVGETGLAGQRLGPEGVEQFLLIGGQIEAVLDADEGHIEPLGGVGGAAQHQQTAAARAAIVHLAHLAHRAGATVGLAGDRGGGRGILGEHRQDGANADGGGDQRCNSD
jgi:hypothetical protein